MINSSTAYINNLYSTLSLTPTNTSQVATTAYVKYIIDNLNINSSNANISLINASTANISLINASTANISFATISLINASTAHISLINGINANISYINASNVSFMSFMYAFNSKIGTIVTQDITINSNLNASVNANISTINTIKANISTINASTANIEIINSTTTYTQNISSFNASIQTINTTTTANISLINASRANISLINSSTANISLINSSTANISLINSSTANIRNISSFNASIQTINSTTAYINTLNTTDMSLQTINASSAIIPIINSSTIYLGDTTYISYAGEFIEISSRFKPLNIHAFNDITIETGGVSDINLFTNVPGKVNVRRLNLTGQILIDGSQGSAGQTILSNGYNTPLYWGIPNVAISPSVNTDLYMNNNNISGANNISAKMLTSDNASINNISLYSMNSTTIRTNTINTTNISSGKINASIIDTPQLNTTTIVCNTLNTSYGSITTNVSTLTIMSNNTVDIYSNTSLVMGRMGSSTQLFGNITFNGSAPAGYILKGNASVVYWDPPGDIWQGTATTDLNMNLYNINNASRINASNTLSIGSSQSLFLDSSYIQILGSSQLYLSSPNAILMRTGNALNNGMFLYNDIINFSSNTVNIIGANAINMSSSKIQFMAPISNYFMYDPTSGSNVSTALGYITSNSEYNIILSNDGNVQLKQVIIPAGGIWMFSWSCTATTNSASVPLYLSNLSTGLGFTKSGFINIDTDTYEASGCEIRVVGPDTFPLYLTYSSPITIQLNYYKAVRLA